jgi:hypothetical protein
MDDTICLEITRQDFKRIINVSVYLIWFYLFCRDKIKYRNKKD